MPAVMMRLVRTVPGRGPTVPRSGRGAGGAGCGGEGGGVAVPEGTAGRVGGIAPGTGRAGPPPCVGGNVGRRGLVNRRPGPRLTGGRAGVLPADDPIVPHRDSAAM